MCCILGLSVPSSSDLPTLPSPRVVMDTDTAPITKVNKQKLSRQLAVTDDDGDGPHTPPVMATTADDKVEDVTTPLANLSIGIIVCIVV